MYIPKIPKTHDWTGQFLISQSDAIRNEWVEKLQILDQFVYLYSETKSILIKNNRQELVGLFIGTIIDTNAQTIVESDITINTTVLAEDQIESFAYKYAGSWLLITSFAQELRVYLDADGSIPLVYDTSTGCAASTTPLILTDEEYISRFDSKLFTELDVLGQGWFPSGLTAHKGIDKLLCNHYLNLTSLNVQRHWPIESFNFSGNVKEASIQISESVKSSAIALLKQGKVTTALTGGNETRFLMAAYKDIRHEFDFITLSGPTTQRDVYLAKKIQNITNVKHSYLPLIPANQEEQDKWIFQASHGCSTNMTGYTTLRPLANKYTSFIGGLGGEIGRGFIWRKTDTENTEIDAKGILSRLGLAATQETISRTEKWLEPIQGMNSLSKLDLAYLELRMSAWAFCHSYPTFVPHFHPLISRSSYNLMLNLSTEDKRNNSLINEGVKSLWPELLQIPINRYGNYKDISEKIYRLSKPELWLKKVRKLYG